MQYREKLSNIEVFHNFNKIQIAQMDYFLHYNYVGKDNIYTNSAGITRYSPLAEWRHEDILAYIHYYDVKLPPIYDWEKGYLCGTHPWPARQYMETEQQGWKEVYDIDKTIVENAAQHFDGARDFLKAIK